MVRIWGFCFLVFIILLGHSTTQAFPAKDIKVVLDREYFQVARGGCWEMQKNPFK